MCRDASRRVVLGLGGSGSGDGACTTTGSACLGGGGVLCELCALSGAFLATGSSTMTIFFFLGALSGAPFGLPRFLGAGSTCGFSETASSFSGIVSFVSGIVSVVSAILLLLNIFSINQKNKTNIRHNSKDVIVPVAQLKG